MNIPMSAARALALLISFATWAVPVFADDSPSARLLHYRPVKGAFADAIPFYHEGVYHVFYLWAGVEAGTTWEHISSTDLVNWKPHPTALPRGKRDEQDGDSVFTGSAIERGGIFHIFYTGWNPAHSARREQIMHATSPDLDHWTKIPADAFHADGKLYQDDGGKDFRDPMIIWNAQSEQYWMLLFARRASDGRGVAGRFTSKDLTNWQPAEPLDCGAAGECPDLFPIGDRWYYLTSFGGMWWASSDRMDGKYQSLPVPQLDTPMVYAVKRTFDGKRHVAFGFVRDLQDGHDLGGKNWGGTMCLPREVYRGDAGQLRVRPVSEVTAAYSRKVLSLEEKPSFTTRAGSWEWDGASLKGRGDPAAAVFKVPSNYMLRLEAKPSSVGRLTVRFRDTGPSAGYTLVVDVKHQSTELRGSLHEFRRATAIPWDRPVIVQAFVDGTIIECFVNDAYAFTCRAYDFDKGELSIGADDSGVVISKMTVQTLGINAKL